MWVGYPHPPWRANCLARAKGAGARGALLFSPGPGSARNREHRALRFLRGLSLGFASYHGRTVLTGMVFVCLPAVLEPEGEARCNHLRVHLAGFWTLQAGIPPLDRLQLGELRFRHRQLQPLGESLPGRDQGASGRPQSVEPSERWYVVPQGGRAASDRRLHGKERRLRRD